MVVAVLDFGELLGLCSWLFFCLRLDNVKSKSQRKFVFDLSLAAVVLVLYLLNKSKGLFYFLPFAFGRNYMNDLLAGVLFPAFLNLTLEFSKYDVRVSNLIHLVLIALGCSFVWEFIYPAFINNASTSDLLDCACYVVGSVIYFSLFNFVMERERNLFFALL